MGSVALAAALLLAEAAPERVMVANHAAICVAEDSVSRADGLGAAVAHALERLLADLRRGESVRGPSATEMAPCDTERGDIMVRLSVSTDRAGRTSIVGLAATDGVTTYRDAVTREARSDHAVEATGFAERLFQRLVFEPHE